MNTTRILVAGIGNIFLGDDAFGVEVVQRLAGRLMSPEVCLRDFGIRGIDLTYALLENYAKIILVDTVQRGGKPGTVYMIEPQLVGRVTPCAPPSLENVGAMPTHEITPEKALASAKAMGAKLTNVLIVGCEPESFGTEDEPQMGLSPAVETAVAEAMALIEEMVAKTLEAAHA